MVIGIPQLTALRICRFAVSGSGPTVEQKVGRLTWATFTRSPLARNSAACALQIWLIRVVSDRGVHR